MSAADTTGSRPAQAREASRCPDCGSLDPCEHDEQVDAVFAALLTFAAVGVVCTLVAVSVGVVALVTIRTRRAS